MFWVVQRRTSNKKIDENINQYHMRTQFGNIRHIGAEEDVER